MTTTTPQSRPTVDSGSLDVADLRSRFPSLTSGIAHFDGPGGTQTPADVGAAIAATITGPLSNRGSRVTSERHADQAVAAFRSAYADLLNADRDGIVYGRSATQLSYDFARHFSAGWKTGDEIVVSRLEHDANVRPWVQSAERVGAVVRWIDFEPATGEVDLDSVSAALNERSRFVAVTAASNLIGSRPPIRQIADLVHANTTDSAEPTRLWVDGVHDAAHNSVDLAALGADFFVCSPYKFFGPHCAVLAADPALLQTVRPDKLLPSTDRVPERFEFGTLPYETLAGATAAVDFIASIAPGAAASRREALINSQAAIGTHEDRLKTMIDDGLAELGQEVTRYGRAADRTPTQLITVAGHSMREASDSLAGLDVLAPCGTFYAVEPARRLALPDPEPIRVGVAAYTDDTDVQRLLDGLAAFLNR